MLARAIAIAAALAGCAPADRPVGARPSVTTARSGVAAPTRSAPPRVEVDLVGPTHVLYSPATLAAPRPTVQITITNPGPAPLDVSGLRARLEVERDGVPIDCARPPATAPAPSERAPASLAAGQRRSFERTLDCALPLTGAYHARVVVAFGKTGPWADGRVASELTLGVTAPPGAEPRPVPGVPGLHAGVGASTVVPSSPVSGRIALALVNAGPRPIALPPMRLALRVYRAGTSIPCEDEPVALALPPELAPGASHRLPIAVSCLGLGVTGTYEVDARLLVSLDGVERRAHAGRLRVDVARDPHRIAPFPRGSSPRER